MSDEEQDRDEQEGQEKRKRKRKGEGGKAGAGRERPIVSEAAQALMREHGVTFEQVKDILKNWRHLDAKEVAVRLAEFGSLTAKASVHMLVTFTRTKAHTLMFQFLKHVRHLGGLSRRLEADRRLRPSDRNDPNLG